MRKKGQLSISDGPTVVLVVGIMFLVLATIAFVGEKYQSAFDAGLSAAVTNETVTSVTEFGQFVGGTNACNAEGFSITAAGCLNSTDGITIPTTNYSLSASGLLTRGIGGLFNNTDWKCSYTYDYTGAACNVTRDLQTEISNNTGIAGIVLTISLIGVVLSILVGVFLLVKARRL